MSNPAPSKLFCSHFIVASTRSYQLVKLVKVDIFAINTCLEVDRYPNIDVSNVTTVAAESCTLFLPQNLSKKRRILRAQEPPQVYFPVLAKPSWPKAVVGDLASRTNPDS